MIDENEYENENCHPDGDSRRLNDNVDDNEKTAALYENENEDDDDFSTKTITKTKTFLTSRSLS